MERTTHNEITHLTKQDLHSGVSFSFFERGLKFLAEDDDVHPEFSQVFIDSKVNYEVMMGDWRAFVLYRDENSFGLVIVSTMLDYSIKYMKYHWDRQLLGIPKITETEDDYWQGWIPLLLVSDLVNGSTTFNEGFRKSLSFLVRQCSRKTLGGHHLVRDLPRADTTFSLKDNVYTIRVGELTRQTSEFSGISERTMRWMMGSAVIKARA